MKVSVLRLKEKATKHWFSYFQIAPKYLKYYYADCKSNKHGPRARIRGPW